MALGNNRHAREEKPKTSRNYERLTHNLYDRFWPIPADWSSLAGRQAKKPAGGRDRPVPTHSGHTAYFSAQWYDYTKT